MSAVLFIGFCTLFFFQCTRLKPSDDNVPSAEHTLKSCQSTRLQFLNTTEANGTFPRSLAVLNILLELYFKNVLRAG